MLEFIGRSSGFLVGTYQRRRLAINVWRAVKFAQHEINRILRATGKSYEFG
jgi:hypothetical protein